MALIIPISELHRLWKDVTVTVNPWLHRNYPFDIQWYVKFLGININDVIVAIIIYRLSRMNETLRITAGVYLTFKLLDLWMFFYSFNQSDYLIFYSCIGLVIALFGYFKKIDVSWVNKVEKKIKDEITKVNLYIKRLFHSNPPPHEI